jgi:hypothetical protein
MLLDALGIKESQESRVNTIGQLVGNRSSCDMVAAFIPKHHAISEHLNPWALPAAGRIQSSKSVGMAVQQSIKLSRYAPAEISNRHTSEIARPPKPIAQANKFHDPWGGPSTFWTLANEPAR